MSVNLPCMQLARTARTATRANLSTPASSPDLYLRLSSLYLQQIRQFQNSCPRHVVPQFRNTTASKNTTSSTGSTTDASTIFLSEALRKTPKQPKKTLEETAASADEAARRARARLRNQQAAAQSGIRLGGLANNSLFADDVVEDVDGTTPAEKPQGKDPLSLESRDLSNLSMVLNPNPSARARWQRKMVIRHVRHRGRLTKEMKIARSERSSLSKSHFFKTSMKKIAPLARQIAGKPIDEAIMQMRFSVKKVAQEVRAHLIQARDEAIVARGMGLGRLDQDSSNVTAFAEDPSTTPPLPNQTPMKSYKHGHQPQETDIYIAQAWVNRGPYGQKPDYRAFGRMYIMRPPNTGISVLLKEEKSRTREKAEREARAIKRRMGKNMWTQLPDRKIIRQGQTVLW